MLGSQYGSCYSKIMGQRSLGGGGGWVANSSKRGTTEEGKYIQ